MRSIRKLSLPAIKLMQAIRYLRCRQSLDQYHIESQQLPEFPRNHDTGKAVGRVVQIVAESVLSDTEQLPNDERVASAVAPAGVAGFVKQRIDIPNDGDAVETALPCRNVFCFEFFMMAYCLKCSFQQYARSRLANREFKRSGNPKSDKNSPRTAHITALSCSSLSLSLPDLLIE